jgi:hypothetical protein
MKELPDLVLAYGNSDEFRYVYLDCRLHPEQALWRLVRAGMQVSCVRAQHVAIVFQGKADVLHSFVFHKDCILFERRARYGLWVVSAPIQLHCCLCAS